MSPITDQCSVRRFRERILEALLPAALCVAGLLTAFACLSRMAEIPNALAWPMMMFIAASCGTAACLSMLLRRSSRKLTRLREFHGLSREILDSIPEPILSIGMRGTIFTCNPAGEKLFGFGDIPWQKRNITDLLPHIDVAEIIAKMSGDSSQRGLSLGTIQGKTLSGEPILVDALISAGRVEDHQLFTLVLRDLSERVRSSRALRDSQQRFRLISEALPVGVFQIDKSGSCEYANLAFQSITGLCLERCLTHDWNNVFHEEDRVVVTQMLHESLLDGVARQRVVRMHGHENRPCWVSVRSNPVISDAGVTVVATLEDVTSPKLAAEELRRARDEAEAATRSKSEFLANMSHEIRTPMTAILGYTDLIIEDQGTPANARDLLTTVKRNGEHLLEIINDILDISKIEAGRLEIEQIQASSLDLLRDVRQLMKFRAESKGLDLCMEATGPVPEFMVTDPTRLRQILFNLVGNSIKFTQSGRVVVGIRMAGLDSATPLLELSVCDTGIGMSEKQMSKLFRPFQQADTSTTRNYGGTGLGLAISHRLAKMLGGDITVTSAPGIGSRFVVTINPGIVANAALLSADEFSTRLNGSTAKPVASTLTPKPVSNGLPLDGLRLLLAEDGLDNQRLISHVLRKAGATVTVVENGALAVDTVTGPDGAAIDLVLMDMQMPVLDGYGATRRLRELGCTKPIIALTAHAMSGDRDRCIAAGCSNYATKPIVKPVLLALIQDMVLESRQSANSVAADERLSLEAPSLADVATNDVAVNDVVTNDVATNGRDSELISSLTSTLPETMTNESLEPAVAGVS